MIGSKYELISHLNNFYSIAKNGDASFTDSVANFISQEFDLEAVVFFKILDDNSLEVIGKSTNAKKQFKNGSIHFCKNCDIINSKSSNKFHFSQDCEIQISDFLIYETCILLNLDNSEKLFVKLGKKSAFTQSELQQIEKTLTLFIALFNLWIAKNTTGKVISEFAKIVEETLTELKTYANSILGFLNYLQNENLTSSQLEYFNSIKKYTQGIILNINDLAELAKIENKSIESSLQKVELIPLMSEIIETFRGRLGAKKIAFNLEADKLLFRPIEIDEQKFRYVFTMMLFISTTLSAQGEINITAKIIDGRNIQFTISDNSKQFDKNTIDNFFKPFFISHKDEFKSTAITGLSLILVKSFVKFLGGEVSVTNNERGNLFSFTIHGEVMPEFESTLSQLPKPTSKNKVLVIEDDYATSKLLSNYLNKWGYDPTIVSNEQQAFNVIEKEQLLAVILDIELPQSNGLELLKKIHEHPKTKNLPVIVCSVEPEQQKAFMMGAVEYFIKPINYNYLVEVLTSYKLRKNSNVLCVDDDLPTLNLVKQAIEQAGFNPIAINISATVMDIIKDKDIDLAIIDLDMPTPNGFELIKLIKSEKKFAKLPIIIYTGKENYKEDLKQIEGLFEDLLEKRSTNIEDLAETINSMINRYETLPPAEEVIKKEGGLKILLAEDYKHSQIIVTRLLKKNGFEDIVVVENGEDAIKMAQEKKFDLILMDMQMPVMNGFEATEKIRELPEYKNTPIIALTAFAMKGDREKCIEVGATDYIPKPIDSKEFIEKVKYYTNTLA